jgi:hypothetical protein
VTGDYRMLVSVSMHGPRGSAATASIDDLSRTILAWLDQRPPGFVRRAPSDNWSPPELQDSFRANLEAALVTAVTASRLADVTSYLIDAFTLAPADSASGTARWSIALRESSSLETFPAMREDMTRLLERGTGGQAVTGVQPRELADLIVRALNDALSDEAYRAPVEGISPERVLQHYLIPVDVQRVYNVRTFLLFLGATVAAFVVYALIEPGFWLNPGTGLLALLAYVTLIVTAAVHQRSRAGSW